MPAFIDVLRSFRRASQGPLLCPHCGEGVKRVRAELGSKLETVLEGWVLPVRYKCDKCGYLGHFALERVDDSLEAD